MDNGTHTAAIAKIREDGKVTTFNRVLNALKGMLAADEKISFYTVAARAQVSRSTLYRRMDLKELVINTRCGIPLEAEAENATCPERDAPHLQADRLQRKLDNVLEENKMLKRRLAEFSESSIHYILVSLEKAA